LELIKSPSFANINKLGEEFSYGVIRGSKSINEEVEQFIEKSGKLALDYHDEEGMVDAYNGFYDQVLEGASVLAD